MHSGTHWGRLLKKPADWQLFLAYARPRRLVVFVHGYGGHALATWEVFYKPGAARQWWTEADMLFVQFDSKHRGAGAVAHELTRELPTFYPVAPVHLTASLRAEPITYEELIVVGHSLGGVGAGGRSKLDRAVARWRSTRSHSAARACRSTLI